MNLFTSFLMLVFLILGISVLCVVKLQFTVVALICCATSLFCVLSDCTSKVKYISALLFITLAILVRKDSFFIFIAFNTPILLVKFYKKEIDKLYLVLLCSSIFIFIFLKYINENGAAYKKHDTLLYCSISDAIADKPITYNTTDLEKFDFTEDDLIMMKARFPASINYTSGKKIVAFSEKIKTHRSIIEIKKEIKKFILDERYMLLVYLLSVIIILIFAPKERLFMFLNGLVFLALLLYLVAFVRIPHRVTFPILLYVSILNIFLFLKENSKKRISLIITIILASIGSYKFYCTSKLIELHKTNHTTFEAYLSEIKLHPNCLFVSFHDGFPIQYMNAWQAPNDFSIGKNLITTGWNITAPDFQQVLQKHHLNNLTTDLKQKEEVLFLTNNKSYLDAYINLMKQRYNINCHFENAQNGFTYLHPKKLVFDN